MQFVNLPVQGSQRVTHRLTAAVAVELWSRLGGHEQFMRVKAGSQLHRLAGSMGGRATGEAMDMARTEALDGARRESVLACEPLYVMEKRMDGQGGTNAPFEQRPVTARTSVGRGSLSSNRMKSQHGSAVVMVPRP